MLMDVDRSQTASWHANPAIPVRASLREKLIALYAGLIAENVLVWAVALLTFRGHPVLFGTSLLAYTFGLRHAVDADHIAAIDNVTRKLMQEAKRPVTTGLFFSLGHSTVVVLASLGIALGAATLQQRFAAFGQIGGVVGTGISAAFLFAIAAANMLVLLAVRRTFRRVRAGQPYVEEDLDLILVNRGFLSRALRRVFGLIRASWHMYPLGILFGLGFDTATEIGVLGISAAGATQGLPIWSILIFPALFTAGMTLIDTTDSVLMVGAYGWAFAKPIRKLYYNMTVTFVSVAIALVVGGVEVAGLVADRLGYNHSFAATLNGSFGVLGYAIIAIFIVCWIAAVAIYRLKGYDRIEVNRA